MCCCNVKGLCCMSLHTAGFVVGWLSAVISSFQNIVVICLLVYLDEIVNYILLNYRQFYITVESNKTGIAVLLLLYLTIHFLNLVASILMIIGIRKNSHLMLLPWMINDAIALAFRIIQTLILIAIGCPIIPLIACISLVINIWIWITIYSLYQFIRKSRGQFSDWEHRNTSASNYELLNNSENVAVIQY